MMKRRFKKLKIKRLHDTYAGNLKIGKVELFALTEEDLEILLEFIEDYQGVYIYPIEPPDNIYSFN